MHGMRSCARTRRGNNVSRALVFFSSMVRLSAKRALCSVVTWIGHEKELAVERGRHADSDDSVSEETLSKALRAAGLGDSFRPGGHVEYYSEDGQDDCQAVAEILQAFGWYDDPKEKYMPIVEASLDIEEDVRSHGFASPDEFWKEMAEIRL